MAHSFVTTFASELEAFRAYATAYPDATTLLIDTYDTVQGARNAATVARELAASGHHLRAVRIDSGDLAALSRAVRATLDEEGCADVQIVASGGLDETPIAELLREGAPIDGFGVGTRMDASEDAPTLEAAYKLVEYEGRPVHKRSAGKASWPGRKQVWRRTGADGRYAGDVIALDGEAIENGEPLLVPVMEDGRRLHAAASLADLRARCLAERDRLPDGVRRIDGAGVYPVSFSAGPRALRDRADANAAP
jgi:nicotinate phosphoribosyltransferase